jgi:hypothetical protein
MSDEMAEKGRIWGWTGPWLTTKMIPNSLTRVHLRVCWSLLYGGFVAADWFSVKAVAPLFSSMKVSAMKLLMTEGLTGAYVLDHSTTPDVVRISNVSSIVWYSDLRYVSLRSRIECGMD